MLPGLKSGRALVKKKKKKKKNNNNNNNNKDDDDDDDGDDVDGEVETVTQQPATCHFS
jgi:hypothetical protein